MRHLGLYFHAVLGLVSTQISFSTNLAYWLTCCYSMVQVTTQRLQVTELRQQRMISFLAKAMLNPSFFAQFVSQQNEDMHVVRKKRRLPVNEDEGDMDDSISPESSIDNQMVSFQRSGLGEAGARAMLYQMFFPSDSPPGIDSNHFDSPMREMDVSHNSTGANGFNRQSRVTLEEITTKFPDILASVPIVTDVSTIEAPEPTILSQPFDNTRVSGWSTLLSLSQYLIVFCKLLCFVHSVCTS